MAIGVIMDYEGSLELYDQASERLNTRDNPPNGLIFHWAAQLDDSHIRLVEVWESQQALDQWFTKIQPLAQELNIPAPELQMLNVHNYQVGDSTRQMFNSSQQGT